MKKKKTKTKMSSRNIMSKTLKLKSNVDPISIVVVQNNGTEMTSEVQSPAEFKDKSLSKSPWSTSYQRKNELEPVMSNSNEINEPTNTINFVDSIKNNVTNMFGSKTMSPQSSTEFITPENGANIQNYQKK